MEIVYVKWMDAASESLLQDEAALAAFVPPEVISAGILDYEDDTFIRIYENRFSLTPETQYREALVIVKGMITSIQRFKVK